MPGTNEMSEYDRSVCDLPLVLPNTTPQKPNTHPIFYVYKIHIYLLPSQPRPLHDFRYLVLHILLHILLLRFYPFVCCTYLNAIGFRGWSVIINRISLFDYPREQFCFIVLIIILYINVLKYHII